MTVGSSRFGDAAASTTSLDTASDWPGTNAVGAATSVTAVVVMIAFAGTETPTRRAPANSMATIENSREETRAARGDLPRAEPERFRGPDALGFLASLPGRAGFPDRVGKADATNGGSSTDSEWVGATVGSTGAIAEALAAVSPTAFTLAMAEVPDDDPSPGERNCRKASREVGPEGATTGCAGAGDGD